MAAYQTLQQVLNYYPRRNHIYVTATTGGSHASGSYHYRGMAIDIGSNSQSEKDAVARWLFNNFRGLFLELIHTFPGGGGTYVKNYRVVGPYGPASAHVNHIHVAADQSHANTILARARGLKPAPAPAPLGKTFPLPPDQWYGVDDHTAFSHSGARAGDVPAVKKIQARVGAKVDGAFGPNTRDKVHAFQAAFRPALTADGKVGRYTWRAMFAPETIPK